VTRVAEAEVRKLFPSDNAMNVSVSHYIEDANVLVTELLGSSSLSVERLTIIEKYLAAHLYVLGEHEGGVFEEQVGNSREKRGSTFTLGRGLELTRWGQMVLAMDTTGIFAEQTIYPTSGKKEALFRLV